MRKKVSMEIIVLEVSCRNMKSSATIPPSKTKMLSCGYCKKTMPDNSLATHCKDIDGKPKLIKGQSTLSFSTSYSSGSKCKKSKQDNYDKSESIPKMNTDDLSEENVVSDLVIQTVTLT